MEGELINRYRNQLLFNYEKFERFTPYLSTELFLYFDPLDYTRQRTLAGVQFPVNRLIFNIFLGHQISKDQPEVWSHKLMLGTSLMYHF